MDEILDVRRMFGLPDYVVRVGTLDLESSGAFVVAAWSRSRAPPRSTPI